MAEYITGGNINDS